MTTNQNGYHCRSCGMTHWTTDQVHYIECIECGGADLGPLTEGSGRITPIGAHARAAVEYVELQERVGLARAAIDDVYRQITVVGESGVPALSFAACANARTCATRAADALAAVAVFVEAMGECVSRYGETTRYAPGTAKTPSRRGRSSGRSTPPITAEGAR